MMQSPATEPVHLHQQANPIQPQISYASMLKVRGSAPVPIRPNSGHVVAFYPAEGQSEALKTAEDTKTALQKAINPTVINVQVERVRKIANAGVIVQTATREEAERLKSAAPPTLTARDAKRRQPLVALLNLKGDPALEDILLCLNSQNDIFRQNWPVSKMRTECKLAFKKSRQGDSKTTVVLECTPNFRAALLSKPTHAIGWDQIEAVDYVSVTCCRKCQNYGHPAKHCRAKEVTCGKCGETGHETEACTATTARCATCKRLGKEHESHRTMARDCPARINAERRSIDVTQYGSQS